MTSKLTALIEAAKEAAEKEPLVVDEDISIHGSTSWCRTQRKYLTLAIPADDSALQERLEQERENCADAMWQAYLDGEESYSKLHDAIRSMT